MNFDDTKDESLVFYYESVRQQVVADIQAGGRYRLIGESVKQYADRLGRRNEPAAIAVYANRLATLTTTLPSSALRCDTVIGGAMTGDQSRELKIGDRVC